jgi:hypothetical protein
MSFPSRQNPLIKKMNPKNTTANGMSMKMMELAIPRDAIDAWSSRRGIPQEELVAWVSTHIVNFAKNGKRILDRLREDPRAFAVLKKIVKKPEDTVQVLLACAEAEALMKTFNRRVVKEKQEITQTRRLKKNVEELRQFLNDIVRSDDPLGAKVVIPEEGKIAALDALSLLEQLVGVRQRLATWSQRRWGATRKSANKEAAEIAAIGWIAAGVQRIAGKPLLREVAILAEASLGIEVSIDRVYRARKTRRRAWLINRVENLETPQVKILARSPG